MIGEHVSATMPFQYADLHLLRGEVFRLRGMPKDDQLLRLGYVRAIDDVTQIAACVVCGKQFENTYKREQHGGEAHGRVRMNDLSLDEIERREELEQRRLERDNPIRFDQTLATLNA